MLIWNISYIYIYKYIYIYVHIYIYIYIYIYSLHQWMWWKKEWKKSHCATIESKKQFSKENVYDYVFRVTLAIHLSHVFCTFLYLPKTLKKDAETEKIERMCVNENVRAKKNTHTYTRTKLTSQNRVREREALTCLAC